MEPQKDKTPLGEAVVSQVAELLRRHRLVEGLVSRQEMPRHGLVEGLIHKLHLVELQKTLDTLHPADIAYVLEALPLDERLIVWDLVKAERGGAVSVVGVYAAPPRDFPLDMLFEKGLRFRGGQAPVHPKLDGLLELVLAGQLTAEDIVTHRLPLSEGPAAYQLFNEKRDGCVKIMLEPWMSAPSFVMKDVASVADDETGGLRP